MVWLDEGRSRAAGEPAEIVEDYLATSSPSLCACFR